MEGGEGDVRSGLGVRPCMVRGKWRGVEVDQRWGQVSWTGGSSSACSGFWSTLCSHKPYKTVPRAGTCFSDFPLNHFLKFEVRVLETV